MVIVIRIDMVIWVLKADWVHFWSMSSNCSLRRRFFGCIGVFVQVFGLIFIFMIFLSICSMAAFFFMNNGTLKGGVSSFPPCYITSYLNPLLLSAHPRKYSFEYGIDKVLGI